MIASDNTHIAPEKRICRICKEVTTITTLCGDCGRFLFNCCGQEWSVSGVCRDCMLKWFDMEERRLSY